MYRRPKETFCYDESLEHEDRQDRSRQSRTPRSSRHIQTIEFFFIGKNVSTSSVFEPDFFSIIDVFPLITNPSVRSFPLFNVRRRVSSLSCHVLWFNVFFRLSFHFGNFLLRIAIRTFLQITRGFQRFQEHTKRSSLNMIA